VSASLALPSSRDAQSLGCFPAQGQGTTGLSAAYGRRSGQDERASEDKVDADVLGIILD
jgi:hypothetical protein